MDSSKMYCLGIVPARGGSKGLPGKNLRQVGGKSLVRRAIEAGLESGCCASVLCSTDSESIAEEARRAGAAVPFLRPAELSGDAVPSLDVLLHVVAEEEKRLGRTIDLVCLLEPTSPLRTAQDVRDTMAALVSADPACDSAVTVCEVTDAHPAWLRRIVDGMMVPYFDHLSEPTRRQDLCRHPTPYRRNGAVYITRRDVLVNQRSIYGQRCAACIMPPERSVNIDSEMDLVISQALASAKP